MVVVVVGLVGLVGVVGWVGWVVMLVRLVVKMVGWHGGGDGVVDGHVSRVACCSVCDVRVMMPSDG